MLLLAVSRGDPVAPAQLRTFPGTNPGTASRARPGLRLPSTSRTTAVAPWTLLRTDRVDVTVITTQPTRHRGQTGMGQSPLDARSLRSSWEMSLRPHSNCAQSSSHLLQGLRLPTGSPPDYSHPTALPSASSQSLPGYSLPSKVKVCALRTGLLDQPCIEFRA